MVRGRQGRMPVSLACRRGGSAASLRSAAGRGRAVAACGLVCAAMLGIRATASPVGASLASGVSTPPPFPSDPIPPADGPVVVGADPFTRAAAGLAPGQIELAALSTRPSLVSGDRVRIEVRGLASDDSLHMALNG